MVRHRLGCGGSPCEALARSDLPCRGGREPTAGQEPAEAPGPLNIRKTTRGAPGDAAERGSEHPRCRRRGVQNAREPDETGHWSELPELPATAGPTGLHSQIRRPDAALGHSNDPGSGPADARQDGAGTRMGDALRDEQLWVPAGTVHDGRDRRPSQDAGPRWRE